MLDPDLLEAIYAAAVDPDRWMILLEELSNHFGARCACLFTTSRWQDLLIKSLNHDGFFDRYIDGGWIEQNERAVPLLAEHLPQFRTDTDLRKPEELALIPVYRDFLIPEGFAIGAGTVIQGAADRLITFTLEGFSSEAHVRSVLPHLDRLRPHLARAASLSAQVAQAAAQATVDTLDLLDVAAAVVERNGRLRACNRRFETSLGDRATTLHGQLRFRRPDIHARLLRGLAAARQDVPVSATIVLDGHDMLGPCVMHLLPLRRDGRARFDSDGFIIIVADPANRSVPKAGLLKLVFDLTPAEAGLAAELARGQSLQEIAAGRHIAYATARTQLRSIFAKVGCTRQGELIALLGHPALAIGRDGV